MTILNYPLTNLKIPKLPLILHHKSLEVKVEAIVDTGFEGYIALPYNLVQKYNLQADFKTRIKQADGKVMEMLGLDLEFSLGLLPEEIYEVETLFIPGTQALLGNLFLLEICSDFELDFVLSFCSKQIKFLSTNN